MKRVFAMLAILAYTTACSRTGLDAPDGGGDVMLPVDAADPPETDVPPIDGDLPEVSTTGCTEGAITSGLLVTIDNVLLRFDPVNGFHALGVLSCNNPPGLQPESMAVARDGTAYVYFAAGGVGPTSATTMYHVDPVTLACSPTFYVGAPDTRVGMSFTANGVGPTDSLYVLGTVSSYTDTELFSVDTTTFATTAIAHESFLGELAGGGDGRLFSVYFTHLDTPGTRLVELDKSTGAILAADELYDLQVGDWLAFFRMGTAFYMFTEGGNSTTTVSRYDLPAKKLDLRLFSWPAEIVGAGASTCASL